MKRIDRKYFEKIKDGLLSDYYVGRFTSTTRNDGTDYAGYYVSNKIVHKDYWIFFGWAEEFKYAYRPESDEDIAYYWLELSEEASVKYIDKYGGNYIRHPKPPHNIVIPFKYNDPSKMIEEITHIADIVLKQ